MSMPEEQLQDGKHGMLLRDVREVPTVVKGDFPEERLRQCGEW